MTRPGYGDTGTSHMCVIEALEGALTAFMDAVAAPKHYPE
jgi:hypothetical protein